MRRTACIVGGGIAGFAAALALARTGWRVRLLERAAEIDEVGAGIQISPNGAAVLSALGVSVGKAGTPLHAVLLADGLSGRPVLRLDLARVGYRHPFRSVYRADLIAILFRAAQAAGVTVFTGACVTGVEQGRVTCTDGRIFTADLIVGADGVRSGIRDYVLPDHRPAFTGHAAWRATIPLPAEASDRVVVYMGPGRHLVGYPLRPRGLLNLVAVREQIAWVAEGWSQPDHPATLRDAFADFAPAPRGLLAQVQATSIWGLFKHPVAEIWHRGAVGLIGDAVHPSLPFLAQGAVMGLEDAWCLAAAMQDVETVEEGWRRFTKIRRARARRTVAGADLNARIYHLSPPLRKPVFLAMSLGGWLLPTLPLRRFDWLYRHDVTAV